MNNVFGSRLNDLRKDNKITQQQLADFLNVTKGTVSSWETGRTSMNDHDKIKVAKFLNTSVSYLIGETDNPEPLTRVKSYNELLEKLSKEEYTNTEEAKLYLYVTTGIKEFNLPDSEILAAANMLKLLNKAKFLELEIEALKKSIK